MNCNASMEASGTAGLKSTVREKQDGDDTEDEDDETVTTSVADLCSASHEFEWLSPGSQGLSYSLEKRGDAVVNSDLTSEHQQGTSSCHVSPARSVHNRLHALPRRSADIMDPMRMSPNTFTDLHGCRRHLSPMRSSWCCPSPPPHAVCLYHGGSMLSGMELMSYEYDCYVQNCSCLPPSGLSHSARHQEAHTWCRNTSPHHEIMRSSSPCSMQRPSGGSRRSRSTTSSKRDCSPSPRYSPVLNTNARHSGQVPVPSNDINSLQKIQELESHKKNLILQASVLADQVEAQAHKIGELEILLDHKKDELIHLEQNLHQEVLARSAVENSKLELMTELSNLRLRLTAAERDRKESDDKCRKLEQEFVTLQTRIMDHETEQAILKSKLFRNGTYVPSSGNESSEIEKLKSALDSIMVSNDEKDQKIEDMRLSFTKHKKLQDIVPTSYNTQVCDTAPQDCYSVYDVNSVLSSLNADMFKTSSTYANMSQIHPHFTSNFEKAPSTFSTNATSFHKSSSVENMCPSSNMVTVPNTQYGTMPRHTGSGVLQQLQVRLREHEVDGDFIPRSSTLEKSESAGNDNTLKVCSKNNKGLGGSGAKSSGVSFAAQECVTIPSTEKENDNYIAPLTSQPYIKTEKDKNKGLFLKFFSKWKKSGSQNIDRFEGDFKRGGIRATAGPRLGWSKDMPLEPDLPFIRWNTEMVVEWLHRLGLSMYVTECKQGMFNGDMLFKASNYELEKGLGIKNPLHKKKLILSIKSLTSGFSTLPTSINNLDYHWVVRWLDDVGLPQYKDSFAEARVDGRVLHCLTIDDLLFLKVTSHLHHVSIRRGIQLLRENGFDPHCLIRRSLPDESKIYTPEVVALWSNHRVMEWLRTVDLSEYAPNLRGSGVHGALIAYEPKFNTNLFAMLLNIPPTKTLLRRHLATHFKNIVGDELTQIKRERETETPLSPSAKIKVVRKSQFALKKKRNKNEYENEDYICPMDIPVVTDALKFSEGEKLVVRRNSDPSPQEPRHLDLKEEDITKNVAASTENTVLSTTLQDQNLNEAPTTIV